MPDEPEHPEIVVDAQQGAQSQAPATPSKDGFDFMTFLAANALMLAAVGFLIAGIVILMMGWSGAAYTNIPSEQTPFLISGGLLGLGLIIVSGFIAVAARLERQNELLRKEIGRAIASRPYQASGDLPAQSGNGVATFTVTGGRSYHVAGCPILEGKDGVEQISSAQRVEYAACKLCAD